MVHAVVSRRDEEQAYTVRRPWNVMGSDTDDWAGMRLAAKWTHASPTLTCALEFFWTARLCNDSQSLKRGLHKWTQLSDAWQGSEKARVLQQKP